MPHSLSVYLLTETDIYIFRELFLKIPFNFNCFHVIHGTDYEEKLNHLYHIIHRLIYDEQHTLRVIENAKMNFKVMPPIKS